MNLTLYILQFSIFSPCLWWLLQEEINCWNFLISRSRRGGCLSKETTPVDTCEKLFVNKCFELSIYLKKSKNQQCLPKETTPVDIWDVGQEISFSTIALNYLPQIVILIEISKGIWKMAKKAGVLFYDLKSFLGFQKLC